MRKTLCVCSHGLDKRSVPSRLCDVVTSDADTLAHQVYFGSEYRTYINRFFNVAVPVLSRPCATGTFFSRRRRRRRRRRCAPYLFSRFIYLPFTSLAAIR